MEMLSSHHRWPMLALKRHSSQAPIEDISPYEPARPWRLRLRCGDMDADRASMKLEGARVELERS